MQSIIITIIIYEVEVFPINAFWDVTACEKY